MRIAIFGNSGSGKSTMARALAERHGIPMLELDMVVWEPGQIAVQRPHHDIVTAVESFLAAHEQWVVEGCYGELIELVLAHCTELVFLNPGVEACVANNRRRPWEPHKYESPEAQDAMFAGLIEWVTGYYARDDQWSLAYHRRIYELFPGKKTEITNGTSES